MNAQTGSAYLEYNQTHFYLVMCTSPGTVEERGLAGRDIAED